MNAGTLRTWLVFEAPVDDLDSDGAQVRTWLPAFPAAKIPCELVHMSGRELLAAQAIASRVTVRIVTRWREGFEARQRAISPHGVIYNIEAVVPDETTIRSVVLYASTGTNEG